MKTRCLFAFILAVFMATSLVAATVGKTSVTFSKPQLRAKKLTAALATADFVKSGKQLPDFIKASVGAMGKNRPELGQVYLIQDLYKFTELLSRITVEIALPDNCDPEVALVLHPQCVERVAQLTAEALPKLKVNNAFVLDNQLPVFINGEDQGLIQAGIKDYAAGSIVPVRVLRARLVHEYSCHAQGESRETACYDKELKELNSDRRSGLLLNQSPYIKEVKQIRDRYARREKTLIASR